MAGLVENFFYGLCKGTSTDIVQRCFVEPALSPGVQGYNPVNTLVYGGILLLLSFFVIFPLLDRRGIKFDFKFILALLPYILFGSAFRVIQDMGIFSRSFNPLEFGYYTYTPGIWFLTAFIAFAGIAFAWLADKKFKTGFHKPFAAFGLLFSLPVLAFDVLNFKPASAGGVFLALAMVGFAVLAAKLLLEKLLKNRLLENRFNLLVVAGQALDGSATFVATQVFSCGEQHPLSSAILGVYPVAFVIVKVVLAIVILHYIETEIQNENLRGFAKLLLLVLGMAPGLRDMITVGVGTCL